MKKLISFKEIDKARKILELGKTSSMKEIKDKYRELSLKYHPDKHGKNKEKYEEKIKEINSSYEILKKYCVKYPISFEAGKAGEVEDGEYMEQHYKRFYDSWWGDKD